MVNHEFNACSLDLYRHGHDWNSWHSENLPAYGSNPPVAIVTLGKRVQACLSVVFEN